MERSRTAIAVERPRSAEGVFVWQIATLVSAEMAFAAFARNVFCSSFYIGDFRISFVAESIPTVANRNPTHAQDVLIDQFAVFGRIASCSSSISSMRLNLPDDLAISDLFRRRVAFWSRGDRASSSASQVSGTGTILAPNLTDNVYLRASNIGPAPTA